MNNISEYNYEAYFLDYHEGRLGDAATKELMDFLARHPELQNEFESFESVSLNDLAEEIKFENKESLKRSATKVNPANFEDIAIEYVEGSLSPILTEELLLFTKQNPKYERELATYRKTKLLPDTISFEDKESLKRISLKRPAVWYYWSAAASVALLVGAYFLINKGTYQPAVNVVSVNHLVDTSKQVQPAISNTATNTLAQNNFANNSTVKKTLTHVIHHSARHANNNNTVARTSKQDSNNVIAVHTNNAISKKDSIVPYITNDIAVKNNDTAIHKSGVQQTPVYVSHYAAPEEKNRSVFALASNTVKIIRKFFKHNIGVNRYIDKDTDKVIAYQISLGDNRYTLPIRNNSY